MMPDRADRQHHPAGPRRDSTMAERIYVALDLETTGLDAQRDTIIEIGAVRFQGDRILDRFVSLVNPQRPIPVRIQQITGITEGDVATAPVLDQILPELLAFVNLDVHGLIAHNVAFDMGFLHTAGVHFHRPAYDTFEIATILLPGMPSYSLGELCAQLKINLSSAHRALDDAEATARLFMHLQTVMQALSASVLQEIVQSGEGVDWPPLQLFADALHAQPSKGHSEWPHNGHSRFAPFSTAPDSDISGVATDEPFISLPEAAVLDCLAPDGPLARQMGDTYEARAGQAEMARLVLDAFNKGDHRLIEGGTGTGKSLAYLIPATLWSVANRQRVVIATNTITLQDQLVDQDIPQVQVLLADSDRTAQSSVRVALLKGRSHYLCTRRLHEWRRGHRLSPVELRLLAKVLVWLPTTQTGDASELSLNDPREQAIWTEIASDPLTCTPERCSATGPVDHLAPTRPPERFRDFFWDARRRAEAAHLIIVNHALLLADIHTGGRVLPPYSHLIVDEAHHLEEATTNQLTYRSDQKQMESLLHQLRPNDERSLLLGRNPRWLAMAKEIERNAQQAIEPLRTFNATLLRFLLRQKEIRPQAGYTQRFSLDSGVRTQPRWSQIEVEWDQASTRLRQVLNQLQGLVEELEAARWWQKDPHALHLNDLKGLADLFAELLEQLDEVIFQPMGLHNDVVTWLELSADADSVIFCAAPVHVGELLDEALIRPRRTVILTGATLRTGEGFDFIQERLGCWSAKATTIDSPFDYRKTTLLYLPSDMPTPDRSTYQQAVEQAIIETAQAAGGRTLALFTSYGQLRATAEAIRSPLDQLGITVLQHGIGSRRRLLQEYRNTNQAVLLGTGTFWEGIDLPGQLLSCLMIVRLPFAVPTDPLFVARSSLFDDPFNDYVVPDAVLRFRQGFGRLIRRASDRGVVVLLDSRVWRKAYGAAFLDALPPCTTRHAPLMNLGATIQEWLADEPWPMAEDEHDV